MQVITVKMKRFGYIQIIYIKLVVPILNISEKLDTEKTLVKLSLKWNDQ